MKGTAARAGEGEDEVHAPHDCSVASLAGTMASPLLGSNSRTDAQSGAENSHQESHFWWEVPYVTAGNLSKETRSRISEWIGME